MTTREELLPHAQHRRQKEEKLRRQRVDLDTHATHIAATISIKPPVVLTLLLQKEGQINPYRGNIFATGGKTFLTG